MKMWSLLMFVLCSALSCVTSAATVFGYEGSNVDISCLYDPGYEEHEKYFCKSECRDDNDVLIKTTQAKTTKYSIYDDKQKQTFIVTISRLEMKDAKTYCCGVTRIGIDKYPCETELKVLTDSCCDDSTKIQSYEKGSVSISCSYESEYRSNLKYICRGEKRSTCLQQALITSDNRQKTRFSLSDYKMSKRFTVTITGLTQKDSGSYLCGIHTNNNPDVFSAVELKVKVYSQQTSTVVSVISTEPITSQPTHTTSKSIEDDTSSQTVTYIVLTVTLTLLILASFLVMVYKCKEKRPEGNINRQVTEAANTENTIYESLEDTAESRLHLSKQKRTRHNDGWMMKEVEIQENIYQSIRATEDIYSVC